MPSQDRLFHLFRIGISPSWSTSLRRTYATTSHPSSPAGPDAQWSHPVHTSSRLTDRKSIFLAHASILPAPAALPNLIAHLRTLPGTNVKRATHCMYAYRAAGVAGQSDGGEGGSGDRLARLLGLSGCENVVVIVWRWYGGVKLGADRWKRISEVAREALGSGDFLVNRNGAEGQNKKRKKKR
ncbi:ribosomal protein S5 domain 2-type protein [Mycena galericulata]|nr:ribosomal protein S5 domain 2-type protein [Mycena galericulata]